MPVFRVEKNKDYTVMSNFHLRDSHLSLKAKGLLSLMLSLPDNWDYSLKGLAAINKDGVDSVSSGVQELEEAGYIKRNRKRDPQGRVHDTEYVVYEEPQKSPETQALLPKRENPVQVKKTPKRDFPVQVFPVQVFPDQEKRPQSNTKVSSTDSNKYVSINQSIDGSDEARVEEVRDRIGYYEWISDPKCDIEFYDAVVSLMQEVYASRQLYTRIGSRDISTRAVKETFDRINSLTVDYVHDRWISYTADNEVSNPKALLLTFLYNSPTTMPLYYGSKARYDMNNRWHSGDSAATKLSSEIEAALKAQDMAWDNDSTTHG